MTGKDMRLARVQYSSDRRPTRNRSEKGAHELRPRLVIYRWGDKLYTMETSAGTPQ
jgi:hypothetical protein